MLELQDDGNLVLRNATSGVVWQSFDTPTDTLLPGQALRAVQNRPLVAWRGAEDWAEGYYFCAWLSIDNNLYLSLYWNGKSIPAWNQSSWSAAIVATGNTTVYPYQVIRDYPNSDKIYLDNTSFYVGNDTNSTLVMSFQSQDLGRVTLDRDGVFRVYSWTSGNSDSAWTSHVVNVWPQEPCSVFAECGAYGICNSPSESYLGTCSCPEGFLYIDPNDELKGCKRRIPIPANVCATNMTTDLVMNEVIGYNVDLDFPSANRLNEFQNVTEQWCADQCLNNCRCAGAVFWRGDVLHRCYIKSEPLFNGGYQDPEDSFSFNVGNHSAYLKILNITSLEPPSSKRYVVIGATVGALAALMYLVMALVVFRAWKRRRMRLQPNISNLDLTLIGPRKFTLRELNAATNNFSQSELIGYGGMGSVYKGVLKDAVVAVKRIRHEARGSEKGFLDEASSISQIRHRNLVQLKGWCIEDGMFLLVYEYMPNGSLDQWLYNKGSRSSQRQRSRKDGLSWSLRYSILTDIAAAIEYLHEDWQQCVLHRDIKSGNVLLDAEFTAHLGDFGLARLIDHQKMEKTTMMAGTFGYMAPEMPYTGKATKETDVYSFGVLMLEVVCGKKPMDSFGDLDNLEGPDDVVLLHRVRRAHHEGNLLATVDPSLQSPSSWNADATRESALHETDADFAGALAGRIDDEKVHEDDQKLVVLKLGLLCCLPNPSARPAIRLVRQILTGDVTTLPPLPNMSQWINLDALDTVYGGFHRPQPLQESRSLSSASSTALNHLAEQVHDRISALPTV